MTSGGNMYHKSGYAGLPEACHPTGGLLDEKVHDSSSGQNKVLNASGETLIGGPLGTAGTLLLEKAHA